MVRPAPDRGADRDPEEPAAHVSDYLALLPSGPDAVRRLILHRFRAAVGAAAIGGLPVYCTTASAANSHPCNSQLPNSQLHLRQLPTRYAAWALARYSRFAIVRPSCAKTSRIPPVYHAATLKLAEKYMAMRVPPPTSKAASTANIRMP
jgi:hypothetical protein